MSGIHRSFLARAAFMVCAVVLMRSALVQARELGVDVSHHQASTGIPLSSWNAMKLSGKEFAYVKATEGLLPPGNIDPAWPNNVSRASAAGIYAGVYHFARPDNRPNIQGALDEANHFVATAGSAMNVGNLRPVIDLERGNALSTSLLTEWVLAFVGRVVELKGPQAEPLVYTSRGYAHFELDSRVADLDAWIVDLNGQDPQTGAPLSTGFFSNWSIWQYSHTGSSGGISPLDLNVVHSEFAPLSSLVIPEPASLSLLAAAVLMLRVRGRRGIC